MPRLDRQTTSILAVSQILSNIFEGFPNTPKNLVSEWKTDVKLFCIRWRFLLKFKILKNVEINLVLKKKTLDVLLLDA